MPISVCFKVSLWWGGSSDTFLVKDLRLEAKHHSNSAEPVVNQKDRRLEQRTNVSFLGCLSHTTPRGDVTAAEHGVFHRMIGCMRMVLILGSVARDPVHEEST